jgi:hypothetical protein
MCGKSMQQKSFSLLCSIETYKEEDKNIKIKKQQKAL